jgi:hypothetical protein
MRNPWGSEKYNGAWCDKNLSDHAKKALNHTSSNDGTFYVPVADYKRLFNGVVGLHYRDDWKRGHTMGKWDRTSTGRSAIKYTFNNPRT